MQDHDFIASFIKTNIDQIKKARSSKLKLMLVKQVQDELFELSEKSRLAFFKANPDVKQALACLSNFVWITGDEYASVPGVDVPTPPMIESPPTESSEVVIGTPNDSTSAGNEQSTGSTAEQPCEKPFTSSTEQDSSPKNTQYLMSANKTQLSNGYSQISTPWRPLQSFSLNAHGSASAAIAEGTDKSTPESIEDSVASPNNSDDVIILNNGRSDSKQTSLRISPESIPSPNNSPVEVSQKQADINRRRAVLKRIIMTGILPAEDEIERNESTANDSSSAHMKTRAPKLQMEKVVGGDNIRTWLNDLQPHQGE